MSTYTLISSQVLGSSAASVTFSSIGSTYKDLVLRISARNDDSGLSNFRVRCNGNSSAIYSKTSIIGTGSSTLNSRNSAATGFEGLYLPSTSNTANTFSSTELYIPNYLSSANKPLSLYSTEEDNTTVSYMIASAGLFSSTSAITSIVIDDYGLNFIAGSSFSLYGI